MKFLIDNNLSFKLVQPLQTNFPGTTHVSNVLSIHLLLSYTAELLHFGEADPDNCLLKIAA